MKYFEIRSDLKGDDRLYGVIIYDEKLNQYITELPDDLEYKDAPLLLDTVIKKGQRTVGPFITKLWLKERLVPEDRQNIGLILKEAGLDYYDEHQLLVLSDGRCAQDDFYLKPIPAKYMPIDIMNRLQKRIEDFVILSGMRLLVFFHNGETKICDLRDFADIYDWIQYLPINENYYYSMKPLISGYGVAWDEDRQISCEELYEAGKLQDIKYEDFKLFIEQRTISTTGVCASLDCSRQNVNDLVKRNKLHPVKNLESTKIFLKAEIEDRLSL